MREARSAASMDAPSRSKTGKAKKSSVFAAVVVEPNKKAVKLGARGSKSMARTKNRAERKGASIEARTLATDSVHENSMKKPNVITRPSRIALETSGVE